MGGRGFPSGQRGGTQDPVAQASEGSNPSPRTFFLKKIENNLGGFREYLEDNDLRELTI